ERHWLPSNLIRTSPTLRRARIGAWRGSTPSSPSAPGTTTISARPSKTRPSGVRISQSSSAIGRLRRRLHLLGLGDHLVDAALEEERLLGHVVVLALEDLVEAADRVLELDVLAVAAGEHGADEEGLRQEALDLAGARHRQPVVVGELVHAEDRDDVLEVLVPLQHALHGGGDA